MITDIRGSQGGTTFSRNTFANYMRNKTSPVNPNTVAQQLVRNRLAAMSQSWGGLTAAQRTAWIDGAPVWSNNNIFNQAINYTGFSLLPHQRNILNRTWPKVVRLLKASLRDERMEGSGVVPLFISHHLKALKSLPVHCSAFQHKVKFGLAIAIRRVGISSDTYIFSW